MRQVPDFDDLRDQGCGAHTANKIIRTLNILNRVDAATTVEELGAALALFIETTTGIK